jgi:hypothetical protein
VGDAASGETELKMNSRFEFLVWRLTSLALVMSLAACASVKSPSGGVWNNTPSAPPPAAPTTATPPVPATAAAAKFKLTRASVVWLDNPGLPVLTGKGAKGTIASGDTVNALAAIRVAAPRELVTALKARQVSEGGSESITLMPIGSLLDASGATTAVIVRAIVTQRSTGSQWRVDLELGNRSSAIIAKQAGNTVNEQAATYSNNLVGVMQKAGLL